MRLVIYGSSLTGNPKDSRAGVRVRVRPTTAPLLIALEEETAPPICFSVHWSVFRVVSSMNPFCLPGGPEGFMYPSQSVQFLAFAVSLCFADYSPSCTAWPLLLRKQSRIFSKPITFLSFLPTAILRLTHYRPAMPFGNRKIYFRLSFQFNIVTF